MSVDSQPTLAATVTDGPDTRPAARTADVNGRREASGRRLPDWLEARALFITTVAAVIVLSVAGIPSHLAQDGYLALVAGRIIAAHGIPHHDYLTVMAYGVRWTDQQWLAQLTMFGLQQLGGLQLLAVTYVAITGLAFALAIAAARQLGGRDVPILAMLPLGTFF